MRAAIPSRVSGMSLPQILSLFSISDTMLLSTLRPPLSPRPEPRARCFLLWRLPLFVRFQRLRFHTQTLGQLADRFRMGPTFTALKAQDRVLVDTGLFCQLTSGEGGFLSQLP